MGAEETRDDTGPVRELRVALTGGWRVAGGAFGRTEGAGGGAGRQGAGARAAGTPPRRRLRGRARVLPRGARAAAGRRLEPARGRRRRPRWGGGDDRVARRAA